jgi:hypothetical protein
LTVLELRIVPRGKDRAKGDLVLQGPKDCADDGGRGAVELPWHRWEGVEASHVEEVEMDEEDLLGAVMGEIHRNVTSGATKGEVVRQASDEDERDNTEASVDLGNNPLDCL